MMLPDYFDDLPELPFTVGCPIVNLDTGETAIVRCKHPAGGWRTMHGQRLFGPVAARWRVDVRQPLGFLWALTHVNTHIDRVISTFVDFVVTRDVSDEFLACYLEDDGVRS